jgi:SRSO17 transposase
MGGRDQSERLVAINRNRWSQSAGAPTRIVDGDFAFFTTWCPAATSIETLVAVEGHRWAIEDSFETAKNEFGLDHNESRSWHGWHRHVSMVMLAFAMMAVIRHRANPVLPKKRNAEPRQKQKHRHTVGRSRVRRIATRLARKRIQPAHFIAWSLWRRAHQAAAQRTRQL